MRRLALVVGIVAVVGIGAYFLSEYEKEQDREHDADVARYNRDLRIAPSDLQCHPPGPGTSVETAMQYAVNEMHVDAYVYMDTHHQDAFVVDTSVGHQTCDRSLLHTLVDNNPAIMNLVHKCGIKTFACEGTNEAIGW